MKYIRTKDAIKKIVGENHILKSVSYYNTRRNLCSYRIETNRYKIADTIEELCDEFVIIKENRCLGQFKANQMANEEATTFEFVRDNHLRFHDDTVYGAIWTNKGLIFVAKMNDKGELELL